MILPMSVWSFTPQDRPVLPFTKRIEETLLKRTLIPKRTGYLGNTILPLAATPTILLIWYHSFNPGTPVLRLGRTVLFAHPTFLTWPRLEEAMLPFQHLMAAHRPSIMKIALNCNSGSQQQISGSPWKDSTPLETKFLVTTKYWNHTTLESQTSQLAEGNF